MRKMREGKIEKGKGTEERKEGDKERRERKREEEKKTGLWTRRRDYRT